jgi:ABC-type Zn uptake system ZnuABC Zn-binding protein ZnuA
MTSPIKVSLVVRVLFLVGIMVSACGLTDETPEFDSELQVVVSTTFIGDIVAQVAGEIPNITVLLEPGQNPHVYQPTPQDMVLVTQADVIFVNGLDLEEFLDDLLEGSDTDAELIVVSEGIQPLVFSEDAEHQDDHNDIQGDNKGEEQDEHEGEDHDGHDQAGGLDPHVWFDPNNVIIWTENIVSALSALDPDHAAEYQANGQAYQEQLRDLDNWIRDEISRIPEEERKLVTDHTSLSYFAEEYGFIQIGAVIPATTTEAETSGQELAELIDIIRDNQVQAIFVGIDFDPSLAQRVAEDTGVDLVQLYFGSLSSGDPAGTYLEFMRYDVNAIVSALEQGIP